MTSEKVENIWISANHSFQRFDAHLLRHLSRQKPVARWEYYQHQDEPSCLESALALLENYLDPFEIPVNLVGHGTSGLIGLLYARKHPERVKSLCLLGVGYYPEVDWQLHYHALRLQLPCSQDIILAQMVQKIFGYQNPYNTKGLIKILKQDLLTSPSPHSIFRKSSVPQRGIESPLMVCGCANDDIIDTNSLMGWQRYLKPEDKLWICPKSNHFFHYFYPHEVSREVLKFWDAIALENQQDKSKAQTVYAD